MWSETTNETISAPQFIKTITHDPHAQVPIMRSAPGFSQFVNFCATTPEVTSDDEAMMFCFPTLADSTTFGIPTQPEPSFEPLKMFKEVNASEGEPNPDDPGELKQDPVVLDFHDDDFTQEANPAPDETNVNNPTAELLAWHYRLSHTPFSKLQEMAKQGIIPKRLAYCSVPKCPACLYGKATRRPWRTKLPANKIGESTVIIDRPGACVSVDQLESPDTGLIAQLKGIPTTARYKCATVFVDHFSNLTFIHLQKTTNANKTVEAKHAFERYAKTHGVTVSHYHADNGRFAETKWLADLLAQPPGLEQTMSFCGVNAHFQNGVAEKRVRDLQDGTRTQILHAKIRWKNAITTNLWPYALRNSAETKNSTLRTGKTISPVEIFTNSRVRPRLDTLHHIGAPVYVLQNDLQAGKKIGKWLPRARLGIYLGHSPRHARTVALVLNPRTGLTSPQFHVKIDDLFETINVITVKEHGEWLRKCHFTKTKAPPSIITKPSTTLRTAPPIPQANEGADLTNDFGYDPELGVPTEPQQSEGEQVPTGTTAAQQIVEPPQQAPTMTHPAEATRKSTRTPKPTQRLLESIQQESLSLPIYLEAARYDPYEDNELDDVHPLTLLSKADKDTMYLHEALRAPDRAEFIKAMQAEIGSHTERKHWKLMLKIDVPEEHKVLDAIWSMKRKRRIKTQVVYKWKARLNVHGGQQVYGVNFWETFAPVVTWASIRLVLILSILHGWKTRQIDFVLAYPQADVETEMYMNVPKGFKMKHTGSKTMHVLKLLKNLYGQKQAGRVWHQYIHGILLELGY
jgi:hypothetical protein